MRTVLARGTALAALAFLSLARPALADNPVITIDNEFLTDTRLTSGLLVAGPPEVAREMSIIGAAMFDAANAASGLSYPSVAYGTAAPGASADAAALAAGYTALQGIFGNAIWTMNSPTPSAAAQTALQNQVLSSIANTYTTALSGLGISNPVTQCASPSGSLVAVCAGLSTGVAAGNANLAARGYTPGNNSVLATDGSSSAILAGMSTPYTPANSNPGTYIPPSSRVAMFPAWGTSVAPTGLSTSTMSSLEANVPPPPAVTSASYAANLLQTECQGGGTVLPSGVQSACAAAGWAPETTAEAKSALFWNDPGTTLQPPGHWLQIANTLATSQSLSTLQSARLISLVGEAENDAGIAAWDLKYAQDLWRPVTAITDCSGGNGSGWSGGNFTTCDPTWTSLIATPPHPDYVAGHPAFSGAAATVLDNFFGTDNLGFTSMSDTYCNGGTAWRAASSNLITACTVTTGVFATMGNTIYGTPGSGPGSCSDLGGTPGVSGSNNTCTLNGTTYTYQTTNTAGGCNDIVTGAENASVDPTMNDSPLICPITESFTSISDASSGPNGSAFSRIVGGIHTPFAVADALALGNSIGEEVASENNIPEPGTVGLLALSLGLMGHLRRRRAAVGA